MSVNLWLTLARVLPKPKQISLCIVPGYVDADEFGELLSTSHWKNHLDFIDAMCAENKLGPKPTLAVKIWMSRPSQLQAPHCWDAVATALRSRIFDSVTFDIVFDFDCMGSDAAELDASHLASLLSSSWVKKIFLEIAGRTGLCIPFENLSMLRASAYGIHDPIAFWSSIEKVSSRLESLELYLLPPKPVEPTHLPISFPQLQHLLYEGPYSQTLTTLAQQAAMPALKSVKLHVDMVDNFPKDSLQDLISLVHLNAALPKNCSLRSYELTTRCGLNNLRHQLELLDELSTGVDLSVKAFCSTPSPLTRSSTDTGVVSHENTCKLRQRDGPSVCRDTIIELLYISVESNSGWTPDIDGTIVLSQLKELKIHVEFGEMQTTYDWLPIMLTHIFTHIPAPSLKKLELRYLRGSQSQSSHFAVLAACLALWPDLQEINLLGATAAVAREEHNAAWSALQETCARMDIKVNG